VVGRCAAALCILFWAAALPASGGKAPVVRVTADPTSAVTGRADVPASEKRIEAALNAADAALMAKQFARARDLLITARDAIAQDTEDAGRVDQSVALARRSMLETEIANAEHAGQLGGHCASLARSRSLFDQSIATGPQAFNDDNLKALAEFRAESLQMAAEMGCKVAVLSSDPKALAGHYYLSGIHEVGSELLLKNDGSYEWFLAYGALDQQSEGRWAVERDSVVLTPTPVKVGQPPFETMRLRIDGDALIGFGDRGRYMRGR
jgi:hypothetical protein